MLGMNTVNSLGHTSPVPMEKNGHLRARDAATVSPNHAFGVLTAQPPFVLYVWTVNREKPIEPSAELGELKPLPLTSELISHVAYWKL
jgi:hypothetical protein